MAFFYCQFLKLGLQFSPTGKHRGLSQLLEALLNVVILD